MRGSLYHRLSAASDTIEQEGALREMGVGCCICCMLPFVVGVVVAVVVASSAPSGLFFLPVFQIAVLDLCPGEAFLIPPCCVLCDSSLRRRSFTDHQIMVHFARQKQMDLTHAL